MKKLMAMSLALGLTASLAACGGNSSAPAGEPAQSASQTDSSIAQKETPEAKSLKIGVSLDTIDSDFWVSTVESLNATAKENGAEVVQRLCEGDANKQNQQIEDLIAQGADAIVCGARDGAAISAAVKKCNEAGVPIVMVSRAVMGDEAKPDLQVLVDNISLAQGSVEWVAQKAKQEGKKYKVALLVGSLGDQNALERQQGHKAALEKYPDIFEVVAEIPTDWKPEQAYAGLQNAFEKNPDINLVITPSDALLTTIKSVLEPLEKWLPSTDANHVRVVTFDGDSTFAQMIEEGFVDCGAVNDTNFMGGESMGWAIKLAQGEKPADLNLLDPGIVANLDNWSTIKDSIWGYVAFKAKG